MSQNNRLANDWEWFRPYTGGASASSEMALFDSGQVYRATLAQVRKGIGVEGIVIVSEPADFGTPVDGVYYLEPGQTYFVTADLDLEGARLETLGVVTIMGTSSETASITSTGLTSGTPVLTSRYTMPMRFITIKDVHTGIYIDDDGGANAPLALDWLGVNFNNVTAVGEIGTIDNFVYDTGAFLSSQGLQFTGTLGTAAISNSLFNGDGSAANIFELTATSEVTRRFRVIYSSVIATGSITAFKIDASATVPVEGFILDTLNFAGGGTYVDGISFDDNKARWNENRGINNSAAIANYYMSGNSTATSVAATGTAYKVAGATTNSAITQKFTHTDNRATYSGVIQRDFKVTATITLTSGNNNRIGMYVAKNGSVLAESETYLTTGSAGRAENGVVQSVLQMQNDDYVEIFVENDTSTSDITVSDMNVVVEALN